MTVKEIIDKLSEYNLEAEINVVVPEGNYICSRGDYIIKGVKGEFYPCKPDIFKQTYEQVDE